MDKNAIWKWLITILMVSVSLALVWPPSEKIKLGLDLKGGSSFVVQVDAENLKAQIAHDEPDLTPERLNARVAAETRKARDIALEAIRNRVDGMGIAEPQIFPEMDSRIVIQMPGIDAKKREDARRTIQSVAFLEFRLVNRSSRRWVDRLHGDDRAPKGFRWAGDDRQGPFLVRDRDAVSDDQMDAAYWAEFKRFAPHEGCAFMIERDQAPDGSTIFRPYYIETAQQLTGKAVQNAMVDYDNLSRPKISLEFNRVGRRQFAQVTRDYAPRGEKNRDSDDGRQLAIILDGTLYSAPEIRTEIPNGRAEITGRFTVQEANRLVNVLRTGSLPVPVTILEERTVDPSLGRDAINSGMRAALVGGIAVVGFMMIYYMLAGAIADLALLLDMILLPLGAVLVSGFMGVLTRSHGGGHVMLPTLTLPGIAGIALTLGMAVDANVLIFERIREEQRSGKSFGAAISAGYEKAFTTIADSNLTTLLAAIIMFWKGSGPVRGYAITLSAGILVSMFTAIVVTRLFFNLLAAKTNLSAVRMLEWVKASKIDFLGKRRIAVAISLALIVGSWSVFIYRGEANFGIDFLGGSSITLNFDPQQKKSVEELRAVLTGAGVSDANIQYQTPRGSAAAASASEILVVKVAFQDGEKAGKALTAGFADAGYKVVQEDSVGPQIGNELKKKGVVALVWAMIGIIIYISWRFEFAFAAGAIVALLHDAFIAVGLFCLFGRQLSTPMIAAVLTIIGYSVNDTIVVFDRIREDLKLMRGRTYSEIANISINQVLSRTLLTSSTTLLSILSLLVFGGGAINDFALLLFIGVLVGTYSSIFIATPVVLLWHPDSKKA